MTRYSLFLILYIIISIVQCSTPDQGDSSSIAKIEYNRVTSGAKKEKKTLLYLYAENCEAKLIEDYLTKNECNPKDLLKSLILSLEKLMDCKEQNKKAKYISICNCISNKLEARVKKSDFRNIDLDKAAKKNLGNDRFSKMMLKVHNIKTGASDNNEKEIKELLGDLKNFTEKFDEEILDQVHKNNLRTEENLRDIKKNREEIVELVKDNKKTLKKTSTKIENIVNSLEGKVKTLQRHAFMFLMIHLSIFAASLIIELSLLAAV